MLRICFLLLLSTALLHGEVNIDATSPFVPSIYYQAGDGRSYNGGYGTLEAFLSKDSSRSSQFLDVRLHCLTDRNPALNLGIGSRFLISSDETFDEILGVNVFYDYRRFHDTDLNQIGVGGELFLRYWEFHVNGYIPIGNQQALHDVTVFTFPGGFISERDRFDEPVYGVDFEAGRGFFYTKCTRLYAGAGPYFLGLDGDGVVGGMARLQFDFYDYFAATLYYTYDQWYQSKFQGQFRLYMPLGVCCRCFCDCFRPFFYPVFRNEIIITAQNCTFKNNF